MVLIPRIFLFHGNWTRELVASRQDCVFLFGDNVADSNSGYVPRSTQAVIRGLPNALGICTKHTRFTDESAYLTDADWEWFTAQVTWQIGQALESGKDIVIPAGGIGTGKAQLKRRAPQCYRYLQLALRDLVHHCTSTGAGS